MIIEFTDCVELCILESQICRFMLSILDYRIANCATISLEALSIRVQLDNRTTIRFSILIILLFILKLED